MGGTLKVSICFQNMGLQDPAAGYNLYNYGANAQCMYLQHPSMVFDWVGDMTVELCPCGGRI